MNTYTSVYERCMLSGEALDKEISSIVESQTVCPFSTDWNFGGPLIERDHVYLVPPHDAHLNFGNGRVEWVKQNLWTATVSARTRTRLNPNDPELPETVGRGCGETPLIAAMRAIADSYGWKDKSHEH